MTPAQLQEICIEAEDLRRRVQTAYRKRELTDEDAKDLLRMLRNIGLFIDSPSKPTGNQPHETHQPDPTGSDRLNLRLDWPG